jgi:hypothetical protein
MSKNHAEVLCRHFIDDPPELGRASVARREIAGARIGAAVDEPPGRLEEGGVADMLAKRVQQPRPLEIDISRRAARFVGNLVVVRCFPENQRRLVQHPGAVLVHRGVVRESAAPPACVERLHILAEALVEPEIIPVGGGQLVPEPFVRQFVMEQPVIAGGVLLEGVAVGIDRLVLHAEVRGFRPRPSSRRQNG